MRNVTYLLFKDLGDPDKIPHQYFVGPHQGLSVSPMSANRAAKMKKIGEVNKIEVEIKRMEERDSPDNNWLRQHQETKIKDVDSLNDPRKQENKSGREKNEENPPEDESEVCFIPYK